MARLGRNRMWPNVAAPAAGNDRAEDRPAALYCARCGQVVSTTAPLIERFGEPFCSDTHAEEFVAEARAARVQTAAVAPPVVPSASAGEAQGTAPQRDWKAYLGKALCWGAPVLAVVLLLGGGSALGGTVSSALPALALLACPLGMGLMMWAMSRGHKDDRGDRGGQK